MSDDPDAGRRVPHPGMEVLRGQGGLLGLYRNRLTRAERIRRGIQKSNASRVPTWVMVVALAAVLAVWAAWIWAAG